jgi:hypothetical protein
MQLTEMNVPRNRVSRCNRLEIILKLSTYHTCRHLSELDNIKPPRHQTALTTLYSVHSNVLVLSIDFTVHGVNSADLQINASEANSKTVPHEERQH